MEAKAAARAEGVREAGERTRKAGVETEGKTDEKKKFSHISINGKFYTPTDEEIVKNHPTIEPVQIEEAKYYTGITLTDEEYKKYKNDQTKKARKKFGVYTNKDTAYSSQYGEIHAEFGTQCVRKGRFYGGIAYFDILPHIPQIFENAIVVDTKEDKNNDSNIKGIVDLVGCAYLGKDYIAIVKMNVKEYANNDAKLYDNRVVTIEELTVVGRDGHLIEETKRGSTSPTVSSKYILSQYRDFVNRKYSISENSSSDTAEPFKAAEARMEAKAAARAEAETEAETEGDEIPDVYEIEDETPLEAAARRMREREAEEKGDVWTLEDEDRRRQAIRDHELLADALMEAAQSESEYRTVKRYKEKVEEIADAESRITELRKKPAEQAGKKGTVVRGDGLNIQKLSDEQYAAYKASEVLAEVLGTDIVIETSIDDKKGHRVNGYYDTKTNRIHININAS